MSIKDTLTNNSMESFSFGGKTYTRRVDNGAVVYDISAGTDGSAFSTGWVNEDASGTDVENGATLTFNHNLGTTDLVYNVYAAKDDSGTDAIDISNHEISQTDVPRADYGSQTLITSNTIQVVLGSQGLLIPNIGATYNVSSSNFTTYPYIKVVVSAKMGSGGGGGTPAGSDRQLQFNDNGAFGANANLKLDGSGNLFVPRLVVGEGNFAGDEGGEMALEQSETNNTLEGQLDIYGFSQESHKIFRRRPTL